MGEDILRFYADSILEANKKIKSAERIMRAQKKLYKLLRPYAFEFGKIPSMEELRKIEKLELEISCMLIQYKQKNKSSSE